MPASDLTVALVSTQRRWHGGEEQARLLGVGLRQRGYRCVVLARRGGDFAERMAADGFEVLAFSGGGRNPAALWQIRQALRRVRPDVLHYNDSHADQRSGPSLAGAARSGPNRRPKGRFSAPLAPAVSLVLRSRRMRVASRTVGMPGGRIARGDAPSRLRRSRSCPRRYGRSAARAAIARICRRSVVAADRCDVDRSQGSPLSLEALPEVIRSVPRGYRPGRQRRTTRNARTAGRATRRAVARSFPRISQRRYDLIHAADMFVLPSHLEGLCSTLIDVCWHSGRS